MAFQLKTSFCLYLFQSEPPKASGLFFPQSFIFMTVVYFGPLTCSIITTTRKFFTILASVILFANPISTMQWVGTVLVFLGKSSREPEASPWSLSRAGVDVR